MPGASVVGIDPTAVSTVPAAGVAFGATASGVPVWSVTTGALAIAAASAAATGDDAYEAGDGGVCEPVEAGAKEYDERATGT